MSDSRRLKVNHITQGHPGNKDNSDSNSGLTPGLCPGRTNILKRQRLQKAAKRVGCREVRGALRRDSPQTGRGPWSLAGHACSGAGGEEQGKTLLAQMALRLQSC